MKTITTIKIVELHGKGRKSRKGLYVYVKNKGEKPKYYRYKEGTTLEDYGILTKTKRKEQYAIKKQMKTRKIKKPTEEIQEDDKKIRIIIKDANKKNYKEGREIIKKGVKRLTKKDKTAKIMSQEKNLENLRNRLITETIVKTSSGNEIIRITSIGRDPEIVKKEIEEKLRRFNSEVMEIDKEIKPSQKYQLLQKEIESISTRNGWATSKGIIQGIKLENVGINQEISIIKK